MTPTYDVIIRNGIVIDGTGGEPAKADIGIRGGTIAHVGRVEGTAAEELDAAGRIVTPGFVDLHTHYDGQAIWSEHLSPSSSHGVTTVVMGNCGVGFAPCRPADHELLVSVMEGVEDIPGVVMAEGLSWNWESFPDYLDALDARRRDIDVAAYVPHSPLRVYAMGERGAAREPATRADLDKMRALTQEAIEAGAIGFATSRQFFHRKRDGTPIPTYEAAETELSVVANALTRADRGVLQIVTNSPFYDWSSEVAQVCRLARESGRPTMFTLGANNEGKQGWREALELVSEANTAGARVKGQVFPRGVGMIIGHNLSVNPFSLCPSYQSLAPLPLHQKIAALRRADVRAKLVTEAPNDALLPLTLIARNYEWMFPLKDPPVYDPPKSASIAAQARRLGVSPSELAYDRLLENDGDAKLLVVIGNYPDASLDDVLEMMQHEHTVLGLGDGGAHYGMICDASFPTFLLTYWTRDRAGKRMPLPAAIRALTSEAAQCVGLHDRGIIAPGYKADINIIDLLRLQVHAPEVVFDLPAGGRRLDQSADGYDATLVSGQVVRRNGRHTGSLPGRLVRGTQLQPGPRH